MNIIYKVEKLYLPSWELNSGSAMSMCNNGVVGVTTGVVVPLPLRTGVTGELVTGLRALTALPLKTFCCLEDRGIANNG